MSSSSVSRGESSIIPGPRVKVCSNHRIVPGHSTNSAQPEAHVSLERNGNTITKIHVQCGCGTVTTITCHYQ